MGDTLIPAMKYVRISWWVPILGIENNDIPVSGYPCPLHRLIPRYPRHHTGINPGMCSYARVKQRTPKPMLQRSSLCPSVARCCLLFVVCACGAIVLPTTHLQENPKRSHSPCVDALLSGQQQKKNRRSGAESQQPQTALEEEGWL